MNRTRWWLALSLCCLTVSPLIAQTTSPDKGKNCPASDPTSTIADRLQTGSLAAILREGELARALGLDEDQFFDAQDIIDAYEMLTQVWATLDPQMMSPQTMQAMMMIRFMLDWELYSLLTEDQQQQLEKLFEQHQAQGAVSQGAAASTSKTK